jgi:hypothetical protein
MKRAFRFGFSLLACALVVLLATGCGARKVKVHGKLTYGAAPVTGAEREPLVVTFCPFNGEGKPDGPPFYAQVNQETGAYEAMIPAGKHRICISCFQADLSDQFNGMFAPGQSPIIRDVSDEAEINVDLSQFKNQMAGSMANVPMPGGP